MHSAISRFYRLSIEERRRKVRELTGLTEEQAARLAPSRGLAEAAADQMVENALGVFGLPIGLCVNMRVDGEDVLLPMVVEEPSVVAACSYASKLLRGGVGIEAHCSEPLVVGQIQVLGVPDSEAASQAILEAQDELLALADSGHPRLCAAGGGARALEIRHLPKREADDPCGDMLVVHLVVDVQDAMGANAINSMCERLAPRIEALSGGRVALRILSNLSDQRTVTVIGRVPVSKLDGKGTVSGRELALRIEEASVFAERDPYRACTHNKGIMNGIDAALIALGQDWRAVEAGAHAYAARDGRYTAMASWRVEGDELVGRMTLPMAVGTVGGVAKVHPLVGLNRDIARIEDAARLAKVCAAAGLAQNLAAIRALAAEGIQRGHMRLHARNIAVEAGAAPEEVAELAKRIADAGTVSGDAAVVTLREMRGEAAAPAVAAVEPFVRELEPLEEREAHLKRRTHPKRKARPPEPPVPRWARPESEGREAREEREMTAQGETDDWKGRERAIEGKVLVTGAAGHLGANLVHRLLNEGHDVRVLLRERSHNAAMDGLSVERIYGDLRRLESLVPALDGVHQVFHAAAQLSTTTPTPAIERETFESNVLGTKNLLAAALKAGVDRVVVTGSFSAVGYDLDKPETAGCEDMPHYPFEELLPYARTKVLVEHEALKACIEGLDVVIATSCAILGPNDHKPSRMGQTLIDFAHGKMPAYIPGGFDFVSTKDLVEGHMLAMRRGRTGQKYIISTTYLEVDALMAMFEEVSGHPRPRLRLPGAVMAGVAEVSSFAIKNFFPGTPQRLTPAAVRILRKRRRADTSKAQRELGYRPGSIRDAIHEAYADFARRGLVPSRPGTTAEPITSERRGATSNATTSTRTATGS
ncbi:MAG: hydroxymethylglutaryl-CoA reductase, degradative [Sandaracinaceae bacterium]